MIGSLINLLTRRPDLIIDHVASYAALAQSELGATKRKLVSRVIAGVVALAFGTAAIVLAGVALMLATALPQTAATWAFYAAPLIALMIALIGARAATSPGDDDSKSPTLGEQFRRDLDALKLATGDRS